MLAVGIHPDIRMDGYFHLAGRCPCVLDYTQGPVPDVSLRRRHMGTGYAIGGQSPQAKPLLAVKKERWSGSELNRPSAISKSSLVTLTPPPPKVLKTATDLQS